MQLIIFYSGKNVLLFSEIIFLSRAGRDRWCDGRQFQNKYGGSFFFQFRQTHQPKKAVDKCRPVPVYTAGCASVPQLVPIRLSRPQHASLCWRGPHPATDFSDTHIDTANKPKSKVACIFVRHTNQKRLSTSAVRCQHTRRDVPVTRNWCQSGCLDRSMPFAGE